MLLMANKIFGEGCSKSVCYLIFHVNRRDFVLHVLSEVMEAYINVLGVQTESWKPGQFKRTRVVFKDFAVRGGLHIDYVKFARIHFLDEFHEGNDITMGHRQGYVFGFSCRKCDL